MYFLLDACQHPGVLRALYFGLLIRDIVFTIIPIGIVLMTIVDFSKAVVAGKEDEQQKAVKLIPKRIMYAIIVFAIPWIVWIIMKTLSGLKLNVALNYTTCINNAESGAENGFSDYDSLLEEEEAREAAERENIDSLNRDSSGNSETISGDFAKKMADEMLKIASAELGRNNASGKYGATGRAWCAFFATWVMDHTIVDGVNLYKDIVQKEIPDPSRAGAACTMNSFENSSHLKFYYSKYYAENVKKNRKSDANYTPKKGDIVYFHWRHMHGGETWQKEITNNCSNNETWVDHVGIVDHVEGNYVYTIEGNTSGGKVDNKSYDINGIGKWSGADIIGYGSWYSNDTNKKNRGY